MQFVEELSFDNGAVYKGYLLNDMRHGPAIIYNAKVKGERKTEFVYDKEKNMMAAAPQIDIGPPAEIEDQAAPEYA